MPELEDSLRANFAKLLISLHMDCDPLDCLTVPQKTRVFADYKPLDNHKIVIDEEGPELPANNTEKVPEKNKKYFSDL